MRLISGFGSQFRNPYTKYAENRQDICIGNNYP